MPYDPLAAYLGAANAQRVEEASARDAELARHILASPGADALPDNFRRVAKARAGSPGASLAELGADLGMTKDAYAGLWRRLIIAARKAGVLDGYEMRQSRFTLTPRTDELRQNIAVNVARLRKERGLSAPELGRRIGHASSGAVCAIERAQYQPGPDLLGRLARALGVEPSTLTAPVEDQSKVSQVAPGQEDGR
jgi:DNA-binding XRE family transcriptional regulator